MKEEYFKLLSDLIQCRPVSSDIEAVNKVEKIMKDFLTEKGLYCSEEIINGRHVLYASTRPGKVQDLFLNAHLDVVPAAYEHQYVAKVEGSRLYGRGSTDCLGNAMAIVQFLVEAGDSVSACAVFTADEEIGGSTTAEMVARGYAGRKAALVVDGGGYGSIVYSQKGIIVLKLRAFGKGGHSSTPWLLDNPIDRLVAAYSKLRAAWQNPTADDPWGNSMTPCILKAGEAHNAIPDVAEMLINIRYVTDEDYNKILNMVTELTGLEYEIIENCPPVVSETDVPAIKALIQAFSKIDPEHPVKLSRMCGATDARHLKSMGIPIGIIGVVGNGIHGKEEYLEMSSVDLFARILREYADLLEKI